MFIFFKVLEYLNNFILFFLKQLKYVLIKVILSVDKQSVSNLECSILIHRMTH